MEFKEKEIDASALKLAKRPLGRILLDGGFISRADLDRAAEEQKRVKQPIGEILVRMGALDADALRVVLAVQHRFSSLEDALSAAAGQRMMLGELLLQAGRLSPEKLSSALDEQSRTNEKIGGILVRRRVITERELDALLQFQKNLDDSESGSADLRLGEILVAAKKLSYRQLHDTLARQQVTKKKLGEALIEAGHCERHHVEWGLGVHKKLIAAAVITVLSLAHVPAAGVAHGAANPAAASLSVQISARVSPRVAVRTIYQAPEFVITNADVDRGYVDVAAASLFQVRNNSPAGYILAFEAGTAKFKEVRITGLASEVVITSGSAVSMQPYAGPYPVTMQLSYRFVLDKDAYPGTYAWPVMMSVSSL
ncbi:MAG: hypothetical protein HZB82_08805 [Deltaproteobacteria bacterium]|nr:hypothetical protein [Deltaproteobacteria bacterium]